jgi:NTE family protein
VTYRTPARPPLENAGPRRPGWVGAAMLAVLVLAGCAVPQVATPPATPPSSPSHGQAASPPVSAAVPEAPLVVEPPANLPPPQDVVNPPPPPPPQLRRPRIGLALGGGAARGFAHIGVIQVLEEAGIQPDLVVGTSAGSLVAALYASGKNGKDLALLADSMDESAFADWSFPFRGMIRGEALARYVRQNTGGRMIEQMKRPLGIVATDLSNGQGILFQQGDPGLAVRASSAVPAVFQPVAVLGREYVDGGLVAPVPVRYARQMGAEVVIAVDISSPPDGNPTGDAVRMLLQTFAIMGRSINTFELREADVVARPRLQGVGSADFTARKRSIAAGREAMQSQLAELKAKIASKTH